MSSVSSAASSAFQSGPCGIAFSFLDADELARVADVCKKWKGDAHFVLAQKYKNAHPALAAFARETTVNGRPVTSVEPRIKAVAQRYFGAMPQVQGSEFSKMEFWAQQIYETRAVALLALLAALNDEEVNTELDKIRDLPSHEKAEALLGLAEACNLEEVFELDVSTSNVVWTRRYPSVGKLVTHISPGILHFSSLADLKLEENGLTFSSEDVALLAQLPFLSNLHFSMNRIARLPANIHRIEGLRWLDLSHNLLSELPPSFGLLSKLEILDLGGNPFRQIPRCLHAMGSLREVRLTRTRIDWAELRAFIQALAPRIQEAVEVIVDGTFLAPSFHTAIRQLIEEVKPYGHLDINISSSTHSASFVFKKHEPEPQQKKPRFEDDSKLQATG